MEQEKMKVECDMKIMMFLFLLIFQALVCHGQTPESSFDLKKLDKFLIKKMKKADLIGMQVAFLNDDLIWQGNYGVKEFGKRDEVDEETLFMIASCSKPITALGVLKLVDQGLISLDDPINNHLPFDVCNPRFPQRAITIRMLLSHVSSIKDNWDILTPLYTINQGGGDSPILLNEFLSNYLEEGGKYHDANENFLDKPAGEFFQYCNVGYALLGLLVENVSGFPFKEFMQKEVFNPLEMYDTYWFMVDIPHDNIAKPHEKPNKKSDFKGPKVLPHYGYPDFPDGQIRTTTIDYARFIQMILNKGLVNGQQFIKEEVIDEFFKIQYPEVAKYQALSWNYNEFDNWIYYLLMPRLPSHTGVDPGVATVVSFDPKTKTAAIIFTNSLPAKFLDQKIFYQEILKRLLKEAKEMNGE
jgi:CubicO group peptidase (beta-lactamase class C family)